MKKIGSTNDFVAEMIKNHSIEAGTIVTTLEQTNGKGQRGKTWKSPAGHGFYGSIFLQPNFLAPTEGFYLSLFASVSIASCLRESYGFNAIKLKWPNDIYYLKHKLGGILIENHLNPKSISESIIGIGINLNQGFFPVELPNPISLFLIDGKLRESQEFLEKLIPYLNQYYQDLKNGQKESLLNLYNELLWKKGELVAFNFQGERGEGLLMGVDKMGWIKIQTESQIIHASYPKLSILPH